MRIHITIPEPFTQDRACEIEHYIQESIGVSVNIYKDEQDADGQTGHCDTIDYVDEVVGTLVKMGDCDVRITRSAD